MYKHFYKEFLEGHKGNIHMASHSHHFWPDITKKAIIEALEDAAKYSDDKWNKIFSEIVPKSQSTIADILNISNPEQIAFAPNSHELVYRMLSCFSEKKDFKILTTNSEFHSFNRQVRRLEEMDNVTVIRIDNEADGFEKNFTQAITHDIDLIFISHVFFNSGKVISNELIKQIASKKNKETVFCLDGYHGFCAIPTDLPEIENDIYYLAGGYKYAQAGEGACFMTIPKNCKLRPLYTGWFASFDTLDKQQEQVSYSDNGFRFWGSTQDLTSLYRLNSVWNQFSENDIDINTIHNYIRGLQNLFLDNINCSNLVISDNINDLGHFITLVLSSPEETKIVYESLKSQDLLTDYRGDRLRFGFGLYLNEKDISEAVKIINKTIRNH